jgi:hypothetical protein
MSFTNDLENEILDWTFGRVAMTLNTATIYIGLSTTTPVDDGTNFTEPVGNAYARVAITNDAAEWPAASGGAKTNANDVTFPTASGSWGTVTYFGIFDALSGGNLLASGVLAVSKTPTTGDTVKFLAGDIDISLD